MHNSSHPIGDHPRIPCAHGADLIEGGTIYQGPADPARTDSSFVQSKDIVDQDAFVVAASSYARHTISSK